MKHMLKGNYNLKGIEKIDALDSKEQTSLEQKFEAAAFEKLGGSITFVKKSASFVWKGKQDV